MEPEHLALEKASGSSEQPVPIPAHNKHRQRKHLESTRPLDLNLARTLLPAKYPTKKKAKGAVLLPLASCFPAVIWGLIRQIPLSGN